MGTMTKDEGIRPGTTLEALAGLRPAFKDDGRITADRSSASSGQGNS
jgi:acetyl-CoA acetyltransferase